MRAVVKLLRDLWVTRGRVAFMVLSLSAGLISLGTVLSARSVLQREMTRNYVGSTPASATFDVGAAGLDDATLAALQALPEVAAATRRSTKVARWRRSGDEAWGRATLFVLEDFAEQKLAVLGHEQGARVPTLGTVLVERSAMAVLGASLGEILEVATSKGQSASLQIVGVVHEPALAPAATEQAGYLYVSVETLALLGEGATLDEVRVLVADQPLDAAAVETQIEAIAQWLLGQGVTGRDPAATRAAVVQVERELRANGIHVASSMPLEVLFNAMAEHVVVLINALLGLATLMAIVSMLALSSSMSTSVVERTRELGILRAIGARPRQLRGMVLIESVFVALLSLPFALLISVVLAIVVGQVIGLLSFGIPLALDVSWLGMAAWTGAVGLVAVLASLAPARAATRRSVREALNHV